MKKMNKKGFTIVELVIVIAVIAILAAVMIPTFSGVVDNAKKSAALQDARNNYAQYLADIEYATESPITSGYVKGGDYYFKVVDGQLETAPIASTSNGDTLIAPAAPATP